VRSLAIGAVAAVIAGAVMVAGSALGLSQALSQAGTIAGVALMIFAVALVSAALILTARLRTTLILDRESITIITGRHRRMLPWSSIEMVRRQGPRLLLIRKPGAGEDVTMINPRPTTDRTFAALIAEIQKRLNADRGYRQVL
jgi:hypothetical protein